MLCLVAAARVPRLRPPCRRSCWLCPTPWCPAATGSAESALRSGCAIQGGTARRAGEPKGRRAAAHCFARARPGCVTAVAWPAPHRKTSTAPPLRQHSFDNMVEAVAKSVRPGARRERAGSVGGLWRWGQHSSTLLRVPCWWRSLASPKHSILARPAILPACCSFRLTTWKRGASS